MRSRDQDPTFTGLPAIIHELLDNQRPIPMRRMADESRDAGAPRHLRALLYGLDESGLIARAMSGKTATSYSPVPVRSGLTCC